MNPEDELQDFKFTIIYEKDVIRISQQYLIDYFWLMEIIKTKYITPILCEFTFRRRPG